MDDDVIYHEDAVVEMIRFWNGVEPDTAGIGFNIINLPELGGCKKLNDLNIKTNFLMEFDGS